MATKMGYEAWAVPYTSNAHLEGATTRWLHPRLVGYAAWLTLMIGLFIPKP